MKPIRLIAVAPPVTVPFGGAVDGSVTQVVPTVSQEAIVGEQRM